MAVLLLHGSCHCGAVAFEVESRAPVPFMRCFCSICRKTSGGGGYTVNILGEASSLRVTRGGSSVRSYRALKDKTRAAAGDEEGNLCQHRYFCPECASYLWAQSDEWAQWVYPYASAIDSELPVPPATADIMLGSAAKWADPRSQPAQGSSYDEYPPFSLEEWHRDHAEQTSGNQKSE
ncbi:hypothetical protein GGI04_001811 [Coemansia thaxteri]|uniref:CENP-V/GFA domain-containing protein n=1 Tax=Coemansia thaxteri TaxID=2663907 RepID=A0A9W8EGT9_9FUNG|nr:hypothetical protein H4R26_001560 [Coemansia thaxteri]KAJ2006638.1 hypothetical protein GGI04_001811 [Coemansia thaxteri]KAJ2472263.1 hypothetical protein GGI02_001699 [Coemansia sp. RSA 2322]KAJ2483051.1 hypothetical protein EV174_003052 [Coemansia sp. RSA 2320]